MPTLEHFLRTGELGPIRPAMTGGEVTALLGPPPDESVARNPQILKYGGLQLTLVAPPGGERKLTYIGVYYGPDPQPLPDPVRPTDFAGAGATVGQVREYLGRTGIPVHSTVTSGDTEHLILPSGARVTFADGVLHSVGFTVRTNPTRKQITVSVPEETWDRLRQHARQADQSVSELSASWLAERAATQPAGTNGVGHVG